MQQNKEPMNKPRKEKLPYNEWVKRQGRKK